MQLTFEDKNKIIEMIKKQLKEELIDLKRLIDQAEQESIKAPGKMQSWSDTSKDEYNNVRNSLQRVFDEKQELVKQIGRMEIVTSDKIELGSVFCVDDNIYYIVLPIGGLGKVLYNETEIIVVGANAPLFSIIQDLSENKKFTWPGGEESLIKQII